MYLESSHPDYDSNKSAVFVVAVTSADVHPHIVTLPDDGFVIFYPAPLLNPSKNYIWQRKFNKSGSGYVSSAKLKISDSIVEAGVKIYSSMRHASDLFWLVWQDITGQKIYGHKFDKFGYPQGGQKLFLNRPTGGLELYGASSSVDTSDDLYIMYKETEYRAEKTFIARYVRGE